VANQSQTVADRLRTRSYRTVG